ncbi:MAG TPA: diguanylate cyclase [Cerasibacillus sp.]|uniref:sensor domain-containing diguanylate cyclase n=1 Tax=Cerasibacillus sp. TaxID=2498711 RepID=UPI002F3EC09F
MKEQLQLELRNIFFEVMTKVSPICMNKEILTDLIRELVRHFEQHGIGIYIWNAWKENYELKAIYPEKEQSHFALTYAEEKLPSKINYSRQNNVLFLPLKVSEEHHAYFICHVNQNSKLFSSYTSILPTFHQDLEEFLSLLYTCQQMKLKERRMEFANSFSARLYSKMNKSEILEEFYRAIKKLYPNFSYQIFLAQDYEINPTLPVKLLEFTNATTENVSTTVFLTGEAQIDKKNHKTYLYIPLKGEQGIYGVLQIVSRLEEIRSFPKYDVSFISQIANFTGRAIESAALYQSSNRLVENLKLINETSHQLNSNMQLQEILHIIRRKVMKTSHCSEIGLIKIADDKHTLLEESTPYFHSQAGKDLISLLIEKNKQTQEAFFSGDFASDGMVRFRSVMAIPMQSANQMYGMVILLHEEPYFFTFESFKTVQSLIRHSTLSIFNTILRNQLEHTVKTDYVTGLYSRNHLDHQISEHMKVGDKGTLIFLDIDDFKQINDQYGHHIGDDVLKQVSQIIKKHTRSSDIAARWGGEELAVYLPDVSIEISMQIAERIRDHVEQETNPKVTVSVGVSSWEQSEVDSVSDLFIRTDQALYEAKEKGKNCVIKKYK